MVECFRMRLGQIQPTQLYISTEKLALVLRGFDSSPPGPLEPIPVKKLGGETVMTDGHTRAFAAFLCGISEVDAYWDEDELDWEAYESCVSWCKQEGIRPVGDLVGRVVGTKEYQAKWLDRCAEMHRQLDVKRAQGEPGKDG